MAKFDKDRFKHEIALKVRDAIKTGLLSEDDVKNNDIERLNNFIKYSLTEWVEDRKDAINVLTDFNYDDRYQWSKLEEEYGTFKSLIDIALINLIKFIENQNMNDYSYYVNNANNEETYDAEFDDSEFDGEYVKYDEDEFEDDNEPKRQIRLRTK